MDDKTAADERALLEQLITMQRSGQDGVEAGLKTTEFWLTATAVAIDILGPHFGFLQGIDSAEQGLIAMGLVLGYAWLRTWRKRGGPAKVVADALAALRNAQGAPAAAPEAPPAA